METTAGITGWGEADPLPPFTEETAHSILATIEHTFGPALIGEDPTNIVAINAKLDKLVNNFTVAFVT